MNGVVIGTAAGAGSYRHTISYSGNLVDFATATFQSTSAQLYFRAQSTIQMFLVPKIPSVGHITFQVPSAASTTTSMFAAHGFGLLVQAGGAPWSSASQASMLMLHGGNHAGTTSANQQGGNVVVLGGASVSGTSGKVYVGRSGRNVRITTAAIANDAVAPVQLQLPYCTGYLTSVSGTSNRMIAMCYDSGGGMAPRRCGTRSRRRSECTHPQFSR